MAAQLRRRLVLTRLGPLRPTSEGLAMAVYALWAYSLSEGTFDREAMPIEADGAGAGRFVQTFQACRVDRP
jgi:hypothetical protein